MRNPVKDLGTLVASTEELTQVTVDSFLNLAADAGLLEPFLEGEG